MQKVNFSKFFPDTHSYIVVSGKAHGSDDFYVSLDVSDGGDRVSFYLTEWKPQGSIKFLENLRAAIDTTLNFHKKALGLKAANKPDRMQRIFDTLGVDKKPAGSKSAAKKKPASSKKVVK